MNYIDNEYVVDVLEQIAREVSTHEVAVNFTTGETEPQRAGEVASVSKSIKYWQEWLPNLFLSQDIEPAAVSEVRLRFRLTNLGREVIVEAKDDRGKEYKVFVHNML